MRIAVVSDIHGNATAFEAVLADLRQTSPDLVLHGGDLTVGGSNSAQIVDQVRALGWPGVIGNTDEMLVRQESLEEFAATAPHLAAMWTAIRELAEATRAELGEERLAWLRTLPHLHSHDALALVHASPDSAWRAPLLDASDEQLHVTYSSLHRDIIAYGHIHTSFVRRCPTTLVVNTGSVSLSYDGDPRASYLLLDDRTPTIRRVEYNVDKEVEALASCGLPHHDWMARTLKTASPQMP